MNIGRLHEVPATAVAIGLVIALASLIVGGLFLGGVFSGGSEPATIDAGRDGRQSSVEESLSVPKGIEDKSEVKSTIMKENLEGKKDDTKAQKDEKKVQEEAERKRLQEEKEAKEKAEREKLQKDAEKNGIPKGPKAQDKVDEKGIPKGPKTQDEADEKGIPKGPKAQDEVNGKGPNGAKAQDEVDEKGVPKGTKVQEKVDEKVVPKGTKAQDNVDVKEVPKGSNAQDNVDGKELPKGLEAQDATGSKALDEVDGKGVPNGAKVSDEVDGKGVPKGAKDVDGDRKELPKGAKDLDEVDGKELPNGSKAKTEADVKGVPKGEAKGNGISTGTKAQNEVDGKRVQQAKGAQAEAEKDKLAKQNEAAKGILGPEVVQNLLEAIQKSGNDQERVIYALRKMEEYFLSNQEGKKVELEVVLRNLKFDFLGKVPYFFLILASNDPNKEERALKWFKLQMLTRLCQENPESLKGKVTAQYKVFAEDMIDFDNPVVDEIKNYISYYVNLEAEQTMKESIQGFKLEKVNETVLRLICLARSCIHYKDSISANPAEMLEILYDNIGNDLAQGSKDLVEKLPPLSELKKDEREGKLSKEVRDFVLIYNRLTGCNGIEDVFLESMNELILNAVEKVNVENPEDIETLLTDLEDLLGNLYYPDVSELYFFIHFIDLYYLRVKIFTDFFKAYPDRLEEAKDLLTLAMQDEIRDLDISEFNNMKTRLVILFALNGVELGSFLQAQMCPVIRETSDGVLNAEGETCFESLCTIARLFDDFHCEGAPTYEGEPLTLQRLFEDAGREFANHITENMEEYEAMPESELTETDAYQNYCEKIELTGFLLNERSAISNAFAHGALGDGVEVFKRYLLHLTLLPQFEHEIENFRNSPSENHHLVFGSRVKNFVSVVRDVIQDPKYKADVISSITKKYPRFPILYWASSKIPVVLEDEDIDAIFYECPCKECFDEHEEDLTLPEDDQILKIVEDSMITENPENMTQQLALAIQNVFEAIDNEANQDLKTLYESQLAYLQTLF